MESSFETKILTCADCGEEFVFTVAAQEYFAEKGYTEDPKLCKTVICSGSVTRTSCPGGQCPRRFSSQHMINSRGRPRRRPGLCPPSKGKS